jgi:hypothetical protein
MPIWSRVLQNKDLITPKFTELRSNWTAIVKNIDPKKNKSKEKKTKENFKHKLKYRLFNGLPIKGF